ncbi:MAG: DUF3857 domain-containing protein [Aureispira sp.]|nr:DUF3857 domain-containing protein [Aureispira sp.]
MKQTLWLCVVALFLNNSSSWAQTFSDYEWKSEMAKVEIPEKYKDAKAVIIKSENYEKGKFSGDYPYITQHGTTRNQTHLKIQSEDALEDYQRVVIPKLKGRIADFVQIKHVDVRVRKADGKVIDYNIRELPKAKLTVDDDLYEQQEDLYIYEIPDLAVGDELEQITLYEQKFFNTVNTVNLYKGYPCLESTFTLSVPLKVMVKGNVYNKMEKPDVRTTSTQRIYKWKMNNLEGVPEANSSGTIFTKDLEYLAYELNFDKFRSDPLAFTVSNWSDLLWQYSEDFFKVRIRKKKKLEEFYTNLFTEGAKALGKTPDKLAKLEKAFIFNEYVAKNFQIIGKLEDFEKSEGIDYFLSNGKADYRNMMRIYKDFFERNEIEYYVAFGKSRFSGVLDLNFVSSSQISEYFFVFKDDNGGLFTINGTGGLNELPWNLMGTTCYMKDINDRKSQLQKIDFPTAALEDNKANKRYSRAQLKIALKDNMITEVSSTALNGLYARGGRGGLVAGSKADTLVKTVQRSYDNYFQYKKDVTATVKSATVQQQETLDPYPFISKRNVELKNLMKEEEGVKTLAIEHILSHSIRWVTNADDRILDYHLPFLGTDSEDIYLVFDQPVEITNAEELNQKVDNEFGSYSFQVLQDPKKPNMVVIKSKYITKKLFVSKDNAKTFQEVNKAWEKVNDAVLKIKIKGA